MSTYLGRYVRRFPLSAVVVGLVLYPAMPDVGFVTLVALYTAPVVNLLVAVPPRVLDRQMGFVLICLSGVVFLYVVPRVWNATQRVDMLAVAGMLALVGMVFLWTMRPVPPRPSLEVGRDVGPGYLGDPVTAQKLFRSSGHAGAVSSGTVTIELPAELRGRLIEGAESRGRSLVEHLEVLMRENAQRECG